MGKKEEQFFSTSSFLVLALIFISIMVRPLPILDRDHFGTATKQMREYVNQQYPALREATISCASTDTDGYGYIECTAHNNTTGIFVVAHCSAGFYSLGTSDGCDE